MSNNQITLDTLKVRKKELLEEMEAIDRLIKIYEPKAMKDKESYAENISDSMLSTREKVVNVVIDLVYKTKRPVKAIEVLNIISKTKILKDMKNEQATLAAILSQEVKKKSARLKKIGRGIYTIK